MAVHIFPFEAATEAVRNEFCSAGTAQTDWSWFVTMKQSVLASDEDLMIAALLDERGSCHSALPLIRKGRFWRAATSCYTTEFMPPLRGNENAFLLGKGLVRQCPELWLDSLPEEFPAVAAFIAGLRDAGFAVVTYRHFANWHEKISNFADYWKGRSSRLQTLIQRKGRHLVSANRLSFECVDLCTDLDRGVSLYEAIYATSWKEPEAHPSFMEALMKNLGSADLARLAIARIDGRPAAVQVWLVRAPCATIFKLAHDPEFDRHSPGSLLTHWMMKKIHEDDGVSIFDFGRGNDAYKKLWLRNCRFRYGVVAVDPRSPHGLWRYVVAVLPMRFGRLTFVQSMRDRFWHRFRPVILPRE